MNIYVFSLRALTWLADVLPHDIVSHVFVVHSGVVSLLLKQLVGIVGKVI